MMKLVEGQIVKQILLYLSDVINMIIFKRGCLNKRKQVNFSNISDVLKLETISAIVYNANWESLSCIGNNKNKDTNVI